MTTQPLIEVASLLSDAFDGGRNGTGEWHALLQREFSSGRADTECSTVMRVEGRVVAACLVNRHAQMGRIGPTGVSPEWRRRGLGAALVTHCLELLAEQSVDCVVLEVDHLNHPALELYSRVGFESARTLNVMKGTALTALQTAEHVATVPLEPADALVRADELEIGFILLISKGVR